MRSPGQNSLIGCKKGRLAFANVEDVTVRVFLELKAESNRVDTLRNKLNGIAYGFDRKGFANRENPALSDEPVLLPR